VLLVLTKALVYPNGVILGRFVHIGLSNLAACPVPPDPSESLRWGAIPVSAKKVKRIAPLSLGEAPPAVGRVPDFQGAMVIVILVVRPPGTMAKARVVQLNIAPNHCSAPMLL